MPTYPLARTVPRLKSTPFGMIIAGGMVIASGMVIALIQNLCQFLFLLLAIILVPICEPVVIFHFTFERE